MSAIDSQYEEPFDDESDFSEPELSDADGQDRGRGKNRKCQPEEDGQEQSARWYFEGTFFLTIDLDDFQDQVPEPAQIKLGGCSRSAATTTTTFYRRAPTTISESP